MSSASQNGVLPSIVVVGGGIGGLYAAYLLGRAGYPVTVLEQGDRWGGRIESVEMQADAGTSFIAEYGPMRFEPDLQELLVELADHLGLKFTAFAPTTAPACPTDYELLDIEASFASTAELLMWAVLRMFYGEPTADSLAGLPVDEPEGRRQLLALRKVVDGHLEGDYEAVQDYLDDVRVNRRLCAGHDESAPLLRDMGLWNALAEVISPGALAKIRDSGTFYHFLPHNPNAVEWGIFWLRQASTKGASIETFAREQAPHGVRTLVEQLVDRIIATCPTVHLSLNQRVLSIDHGKLPAEVEVIVRSDGDLGTYVLRADHVILAVPQAALTDLASSLPAQIRRDIEAVMPLPLLKAFLVTSDPWWSHHINAQSHAWLIPTRELHYFTPSPNPDCPKTLGDANAVCTCGEVEAGMVMLYTDVPALDFWKPFVTETEQFNALLYPRIENGQQVDDERLKRALVRHLLVEAHPHIASKIDLERHRVVDAVRDMDPQPPRLLDVISKRQGVTLSQVFREYLNDCTPAEEAEVEFILRDLFGHDESWVHQLHLNEAVRPKEELVEENMRAVRAYGIHDWSRKPFGGAAHVWRPGVNSVEASRRLHAFGLNGREGLRNLHVCGEAYSDFQGFIEGALRSAQQVCSHIGPVSFDLAAGATTEMATRAPELKLT